MPNLKVCKANGMPTIVKANGTLAMKYSRAVKMPPNTSQIMFPIVLIVCDL